MKKGKKKSIYIKNKCTKDFVVKVGSLFPFICNLSDTDNIHVLLDQYWSNVYMRNFSMKEIDWDYEQFWAIKFSYVDNNKMQRGWSNKYYKLYVKKDIEMLKNITVKIR